MRTYSTTTTLQRPGSFFPQLLAALVGGTLIFSLIAVALIVGYQISNRGQIFPGVSVMGIDLSGLEPQEAAAALAARLDFPQHGRILLRDGDKLWVAAPAELGLFLDPESTALAAYQLGREGGLFTWLGDQFTAWYYGKSLPPQYVFDERAARAYLEHVAGQTDLPTIEASLSVDGVDVVVQPGQVGRSLDIPTTLGALQAQLLSLQDGEVPLTIHENPPVILDVAEQAALASEILSEPLTLSVPDTAEGDPGPWTFQPDVLAQLLTIERVPDDGGGERYQVGLQAEGLRSFLEGIAPNLDRRTQNARMIFNDETRQLEVIQPAVTGRSLAVDATIQAINEKLIRADHTINLEMVYSEPQIGDDATAEQLGITELVSSNTSYFYGSGGERIQNIQTAADRFHGIFVPPGGTFSMADWLGDVSLDNGYAEAWIIFGNRTIKGVGGGVCQVSTTLFRTVFFGGYPVVERHSHAYRVYYYEQTPSGGHDASLAGLDATVYVPLVDFKFMNDTPNWLLMETYVNPTARTLTWKFYSTSDGRQVEWDTSGLRNTVEPPEPVYEENPELAKGEVNQVDWEVEGADVTVTRTVYRDGDVLYEDTFATHYLPWRSVYQYGPGTEGMPPDEDKPKKKKNDS